MQFNMLTAYLLTATGLQCASAPSLAYIKVCVFTGHTSSGDFFTAKKYFVSLKEAPKQNLCSLLTSDMLDIASNSMLNTKLYRLRYLSSWHKRN